MKTYTISHELAQFIFQQIPQYFFERYIYPSNIVEEYQSLHESYLKERNRIVGENRAGTEIQEYIKLYQKYGPVDKLLEEQMPEDLIVKKS